MKKHIRSLASAAVGMALALVSCGGGSKSKNNDDIPIDGGPGVYVAGAIQLEPNTTGYATLWKDGVAHRLNNLNNSEANSVFVSDGDVYVVGWHQLWKNGIAQNLSAPLSYVPSGYSVFVSSGDVYVAGHIQGGGANYGTQHAALWKNGVVQVLGLSDDYSWAHANSVYVSGSDVYVAGYAKVDGDRRAILWKNGVPQQLQHNNANPTAYFVTSSASSVFVSGGDVYVAGGTGESYIADDGISYYTAHAMLWKNGVAQRLSDNYSNAASVFVSGNDVYVTGSSDTYAMLWKNGVAQRLSDSDTWAEADSVYVSGNDVYVSGREDFVATLWKNGVAQTLSEFESYANSVFVAK